jgi:hypothetical protein
MSGSVFRRWGLLATASIGSLMVLPDIASAHGVTTTRFQTPLPLTWLFAGAAATVALTALWVGVSKRAGSETGGERTLATVRTTFVTRARFVASGLFLAIVLIAMFAGIVGRQVASGNLATVFTWPVWFRGLAILAILVGSPWVAIAPWRVLYRGVARLETRSIAILGGYPRHLASWPAVIGFLVLIGVIENLTILPRSPQFTTGVVAMYFMLMIGGALLFGRPWFDQADPLGVLYRLFGRVAPVRLLSSNGDAHRLVLRPPWLGCIEPVRSTSLVIFAVATVYTFSFEGYTNTSNFQSVLFAVRKLLGSGPGTIAILYVGGLVGFVAIFGLFVWITDRLGEGSGRQWSEAAQWFAPTILPIAAAYEIAHNYSYVLRNAGRFFEMVLGPLVPGVGPIQPLAWLSVPGFWVTQIVLIVLGHVIAVVAAHHVAIRRYDSIPAARSGHFPLVLLMIAYTVLSLWIISQPVVAG